MISLNLHAFEPRSCQTKLSYWYFCTSTFHLSK